MPNGRKVAFRPIPASSQRRSRHHVSSPMLRKEHPLLGPASPRGARAFVWPENPADLTAFAEAETSAVLRKQKNR